MFCGNCDRPMMEHPTDLCHFCRKSSRNGGKIVKGAVVGGLVAGPVGVVVGGILGSLFGEQTDDDT